MQKRTEIIAELTDILQDIFQADTIVLSEASTAADVEGWDSFKQIEIILAAEARWGIRFSPRELDGLRSIGDLARVIEAKAA